MDRRNFITTATLFSGALIAASKLSLASESLSGSLSSSITSSAPQVRHGLFQLKPLERHFLPKWLKLFEMQHLCADGLEPSENDLQVFLCQLDEVPVSIGFNQSEATISAGEQIETIESQQSLELSINERKIQIISQEAEVLLAPKSNMFCLNGKVEMHSGTLLKNDFALIHKEQKVNVSSESLVVIFS